MHSLYICERVDMLPPPPAPPPSSSPPKANSRYQAAVTNDGRNLSALFKCQKIMVIRETADGQASNIINEVAARTNFHGGKLLCTYERQNHESRFVIQTYRNV